MVLRSRKFSAGVITINLEISEPTQLQLFFIPIMKTSHITCGGKEVNLTRSKYFKGCGSDGTPSTNECSQAFGEGTFWMPTEDPAFVSLQFLENIQPTKVKYKPSGDQKPQIISVY